MEEIKDDLVVHGKGKIHDERLKALLGRLSEYGITLRKEKCKFGKPEVQWFGHVFNKHGMMADPEKVSTVKNGQNQQRKLLLKVFFKRLSF